ncbi:hypothetical protein [Cumulibacter manganitolerans]|uniref:hypothetical protein n=1 Tax=Cumulibacter manganitolerans TaxID=1884992 RepID=UPI001296AE7E|nr:hypothetical protein [Cumulibacter manganitolerans]
MTRCAARSALAVTAIAAASSVLLASCTTGAPSADAPATTAPAAASSATGAEPTAQSTPGAPSAAPTNSAADEAHGTVTATGTAGPLEPALLAGGDVPGFAQTSKGDLEQAAAQAESASAATAALAVQPAQCEAIVKSLITRASGIYQAMSTGAVQGFASSTGQLLTEAIVKAPDAAAYVVDDAGLAGCPTVTATTGPTQAKITIEPLSLQLGEASTGAFLTQTVNVGGGAITTVTGNVSITKNGTVVALALTGATDQPAELKALLATTAQKAYAKAEPAL